jgi:HK97 family phage portal protein
LAREAIGVARVMEKYAARLWGKGARPGGVISTAKSVGDDGVKKMLAGWKAAHEGSDASGKTAILYDGAEWKQMTLSSVDAQYHQLRLFQLQEIARAFNVPASLLGDLTRATWSNSAEMQRQFLLLCLEPWLQAVESALRRALFLKEDRRKYAVRFDRDDFSNVDLAARATAINSLVASRVINPNTGRAWLGGLAPYEGGEEYANPNTGTSQPSATPAPEPDKGDDVDAA